MPTDQTPMERAETAWAEYLKLVPSPAEVEPKELFLAAYAAGRADNEREDADAH